MGPLVNPIDTWIVNTLFVGGPRTTPYGPMSGVWHGYIQAAGDNTGGTVVLEGRISNDRKYDYVHILEGVSMSHTGAFSGDNFTLDLNGGPRLNTDYAANQIPTFTVSGDFREGVNRASWPGSQGGGFPFPGLPLYTETKSNLPYSMAVANFAANSDNDVYRFALWGWILTYNQFYRGTPR